MKGLLIIITMAVISGCVANDDREELTISAAISLSDVMREVGDAFQKDHPEIRLYFNFGASGTLMRQIEQGASVDVFASASQDEMDTLESKGLIIPKTRTNFTKNRLVIVAPLKVSVEDLKNPLVKSIAMGNPKTVPAGRYAKIMLEDAGEYENLQPKFIIAENVRQVLDYVELGEVDAGFVYWSDTLKSDLVVSGIESGPEIIYPVAAVQDKEAARQFIAYLLSEDGQSILRNHGFG